MAYFAKLDSFNIVIEVLSVANNMCPTEQDGITFLKSLFGQDTIWKQTSYNTRAGIYYIPNTNDPDPDQSKAFRKNYAGINYTYDLTRDAFINPKPIVPPEDEQYVSFDEFACLWVYKPQTPEIEVTRV